MVIVWKQVRGADNELVDVGYLAGRAVARVAPAMEKKDKRTSGGRCMLLIRGEDTAWTQVFRHGGGKYGSNGPRSWESRAAAKAAAREAVMSSSRDPKRPKKKKTAKKTVVRSRSVTKWENERVKLVAKLRSGQGLPDRIRNKMLNVLHHSGVDVHPLLRDDVLLVNAYFKMGRTENLMDLTESLARRERAFAAPGSSARNDPSR